MPVNILMPALSPTMEHGNLSKWLKQEGDTIKSGDVIAEIETDKATMEVEAVDEGILAKILVPEGTSDVPVNEIIGLIASEGEDVAEAAKGPSDTKFMQPGIRPADEQSAKRTAEQVDKQSGQDAPAAPAQGKSDGSKPDEGKPDEGKANEGRAEAAASEKGYGVTPGQTPPAPNAAQTGQSGGRIFVSPLAKRLAKEGGLDLGRVQGSGPHGRIIERDVKAALADGSVKTQPKPADAAPAQPAPAASGKPPLPVGQSDEAIKKLFPAGSFEEVPHDSMRKVIARRLVEAKTTIPHFYLMVDCEIDALLSLREQINASAPKDKEGKPTYKVSVNDMVIKAYALGLKAVPDANVSWTEASMLHHKSVDVGVAVSIPGGLITPVIRNAATKTMSAISNEMKELAGRARARKLKPEEYQGGTGAVSNLGMYGIKSFSAVINPPHSTILAVGAGVASAVVRGGEIKSATIMSITLSTDHRAVDGALGAELISAVKRFIENPVSMLV